MTLLELAERCEAATGSSYRLDLEIAAEFAPNQPGWQPPFTASIDAALMLVPDGVFWAVGCDGGASMYIPGGSLCQSKGCSTPALALCAAALRARHEMENPAWPTQM